MFYFLCVKKKTNNAFKHFSEYKNIEMNIITKMITFKPYYEKYVLCFSDSYPIIINENKINNKIK